MNLKTNKLTAGLLAVILLLSVIPLFRTGVRCGKRAGSYYRYAG